MEPLFWSLGIATTIYLSWNIATRISNNINKKNLYKKNIDKGEFYFFKTKTKRLNTHDLLEESIPSILLKIQWKKSMKWGEFRFF